MQGSGSNMRGIHCHKSLDGIGSREKDISKMGVESRERYYFRIHSTNFFEHMLCTILSFRSRRLIENRAERAPVY